MPQKYEQMLADFRDEINAGIADAYRQAGYVDEADKPSEELMKEAAFKVAMDHCVVASKAERSKKALTNGEFYSLVFPAGPAAGEKSPQLDPVGEGVLKKLTSVVWGLTQTQRSGYLQLRFESEETTLVVCRCRVYRNAVATQAVYATDNEALILEDAVDKEIQSFARRANSLRRDLNMIIERHPKLQGEISNQIGIELGRIDSQLALDPAAGKPRKRLPASTAS